MAFDVEDRRQRIDRRSGTVDRRAHGDRRGPAAARPLTFPDRRANHDRRSAYPDRRVHLFDRRALETAVPPPIESTRPLRWSDLPDRLIPLVVIAILSLADVVTTDRLAELGGTEINPVGQWLLENGWLLSAKLVAVAALAGLVTRAQPRRWIPLALWAVVGVYSVVIVVHVWQLTTY